MANVITASIESIDNLRKAIADYTTAILQDEEILLACIQKLGTMWEGEAHDVFQADFMEGLDLLHTNTMNIRDMTEFEGIAVNEYSKADADVEAAIKAM